MSLSKAEIKIIQALKTAHGRKKHQAFLVEGPKLVEELLSTQFKVKHILATEDWINTHSISKDVSLFKSLELDKFSLLTKANQVIAVVEYPNIEESKLDTTQYILVLDTVQDPGNLGTIIRTADWFGIHQIVCSKETADIFNPKVVQASMGSVFRVHVYYRDLIETLNLHKDLPVYGTLLEGSNINQIQFEKKGFIIIGNESKGISEELKKRVQHAVYIPRALNSKTESLNASVACGILLSHLPND